MPNKIFLGICSFFVAVLFLRLDILEADLGTEELICFGINGKIFIFAIINLKLFNYEIILIFTILFGVELTV